MAVAIEHTDHVEDIQAAAGRLFHIRSNSCLLFRRSRVGLQFLAPFLCVASGSRLYRLLWFAACEIPGRECDVHEAKVIFELVVKTFFYMTLLPFSQPAYRYDAIV